MQFPAKLADIGHAQSTHRVSGDDDLADVTEGKRDVRHIRGRDLFQHIASLRPHQRQRAEFLRYIGEGHAAAFG